MAENSNPTPANLTSLELTVYEAVEEIQGIKHYNGQQPDYALLPEVYNFLRPESPEGFERDALSALRSLYRRGLITFHQTVNKIPMFGVKE